jgi:hypothetical protein
MSHQSGITGKFKIKIVRILNLIYLATDALRDKFVEMKDGHIRVVVVVIENGLNYFIFN